MEAVPNVQAFCCQNCRPFLQLLHKKITCVGLSPSEKPKKNGHDVSLLESLVSAGLASVGATTANSERDFAAMRKRTNPTVAEVERFLQTFMGGLNTDANAMDKKKPALSESTTSVAKKGLALPASVVRSESL